MTDNVKVGTSEVLPSSQNGSVSTAPATAELAEETETHEPDLLRFTLIPFSEISLPTAVDYAVKGILPRAGVVSVWGAYSCGKSFWTLNLVMHIALGWEFRGRPVRQGTAVYCAFEGQTGFAKRVEAFRQHHLSEEVEDVPFYLMPLSMDLINEVGDLIGDIEAQEVAPGVVVLDTLARSMSGNEDSNADMCRYFAAADAIREKFDCLVIVVHHCGYEDSHPRGGTALPSNSEGLIKVYRDASSNVCSIVQKYKDGEVGDETASRLEVITVGADDEGEEITSCVLIEVATSAAGAKPGTKLTNAEKIGYGALVEAIDAMGAVPPASNHIPKDFKAVSERQWRMYAYERNISVGGERAKQQAFRRAVQGLMAKGRVGSWQDHFWLV